jgi:hypothetical protein
MAGGPALPAIHQGRIDLSILNAERTRLSEAFHDQQDQDAKD